MALYENSGGSADDSWTLSSYTAGQTFTALSDHTITNLVINFGGTGTIKVHITNASANLPTTDIFVTDSIVVVSGDNSIDIDCTELSSGIVYGFWIEWVSGTPTLSGNTAQPYSGGTLSNRSPSALAVPPNTTRSEDAIFSVYGNDGTCSTVATSSPATLNDLVFIQTIQIFFIVLTMLSITFISKYKKI